eukprot:CAMPEP_0206448510 /NCGR_PEP_ID=MMETSP0324_2-20121206/17515_1 /ASSEMBLY_ACC=CAM_ASM_000836 /TAXON_ID=2866 /ORGANISM="Crypthecodinium cohnii, Strain Seligo" /LENGTH=208 /DNA_ID=CAMNT_0053917667 /DNA_START=322 /DNA_END=948 /DNA_ORIENTATION=-
MTPSVVRASLVALTLLLATLEVQATSSLTNPSSLDNDDRDSGEDLIEQGLTEQDDECDGDDQDCALTALQFRARSGDTATVDGSMIATSRRRRRHHEYLYPTTNISSAFTQPEFCAGKKLKRGVQGCCAGIPFQLANAGCCGTIPYYTSQLGCCDHGDGTATLYDPLSQNCCDDEFKKNAERGICEVERGETSCCELAQNGRRRRRYR